MLEKSDDTRKGITQKHYLLQWTVTVMINTRISALTEAPRNREEKG